MSKQKDFCPTFGINNTDRKASEWRESNSADKLLKIMASMEFKNGLEMRKNQADKLKPGELRSRIGNWGLENSLSQMKLNGFFRTNSMLEVSDNIREEVDWLENESNVNYGYEKISKWLKIDVPKLSMDDETHFCDAKLLHKMLKAKTGLDKHDKPTTVEARAKSNHFESIKSVFFMNRSALKMANIDAATGFIFTNIDKHPLHRKKKGLYYFADVCAGPGGFTEYILWRKKWHFKGFGLTLRDANNDFKVNDSTCISGATFQPLYGSNGDGNIFYPDNITSFKCDVLHETENEGVHFMMSDGGFSVAGKENLQEILSKQLYVCQCLTALEVVRYHGHFVTKLFDVFTPFSVGLLYLMYLCFEKVTIIKPKASRPACSERYFICYGKKQSQLTEHIKSYMWDIINVLWKLRQVEKNDNKDILEIVPLEVIKADEKFTKLITIWNNRIMQYQLVALRKMVNFCENRDLPREKDDNLRKQCLTYWNIPDKPKNYRTRFTTADVTKNVIDILLIKPKLICKEDDFDKMINNIDGWRVASIYSKHSRFYVATSGSVVYKYVNSNWVPEIDVNVKLVQGTILYGEIVNEVVVLEDNEEKVSEVVKSFHVIDALKLGDISLADLPFDERQDLIQTYCKAVNFECNKETTRIRAKPICSLRLLENIIDYNVSEKKYYTQLPIIGNNTLNEYYHVNSLLFLSSSSDHCFKMTYGLRRQLFNNEDDVNNTISNFINYFKKTTT